MFGVGQRDEHTIPSAFAAVAAEHGVDVEVHNYGFPGYVAWQEFLLLEQLLAAGERYDAVVLLDGHNELIVQAADPSPDPTLNGAPQLDQMVREVADDRSTAPGYLDQLGELADAYGRTSAVLGLVDRVTGDNAPSTTAGQAADPEEQVRNALDVYGRAQDRVLDLVDGGQEVRFYWQPQRLGWPDAVLDGLPPRTVDLSATFDGRQDELYIDDVHTNEEGARLLAEAMWADLGPSLGVG